MIPKRKLRATAVRRTSASRAAREDDEPTMRLSSAFIVVVLLHLAAIGGIITFEKVKVRHASPTAPAAQEQADAPAPVVSTHTPRRAAAQASSQVAPASNAAPVAEALRDSGEIHVVLRGENPVTIAKKYGVDSEALLMLNKIEDPRKLWVGQKLHIPASVEPGR